MIARKLKRLGSVVAAALPLLVGYAQTPSSTPSSTPVMAAPTPPNPGDAAPDTKSGFAPNVAEVVKLAQSKVGDEVVIAFIKNSQSPFGLSAADVLALKDAGLSSPVVAAMLSHDTGLKPRHEALATSSARRLRDFRLLPTPTSRSSTGRLRMRGLRRAARQRQRRRARRQPLRMTLDFRTARPSPAARSASPDCGPQQPPPSPRVEVGPSRQPRVTYRAPGYWSWRGGAWIWIRGCWAPRPYAGAVWIGGRWGWGGRGYVWIGGRWR